jgi:16S rRNA G966 N2-methylase RsmD
MKKLELDNKEIQKIIKLNNQGESIREICRVIGRSQALVQRVLNDKVKINRFKQDKDYIAICKKTKKRIKDYKNSSGALLSHIKNEYPETQIPSKFLRKKFEIENGVTWYENFFYIEEVEVVKEDFKKCRLCSWETLDLQNNSGSYTKHIINEHNMEISKYLELFPDDEHLFVTFVKNKEYKLENESDENNFIKCEICNEKMRKITNTHLKKHGLSLKNYRNKFGTTMSSRTKDKFVKIGEDNSHSIVMSKKNTSIEVKIKEILDKLNISYIQQYKKGNYYFDFFLVNEKFLIETDGSFWHGYDRDSNWDYGVFNNVINDYRKSLNQENLFRINGDLINRINIDDFHSKEEFYDFLNENNLDIKNHKIFNLKEDEILFNKEYCINKFDINNKKTIKLIDNLLFWWKEFYNPNNYKKFVNLQTRKNIDFRLKGIFFKELYSAHKINNKNIFELFESDDILRKTITYRLGINKSREFFDLNIKNLYRGIEVRTLFNVGIFPVKKAKKIFEDNIDDDNIIFDPFIGWGSRMLSLNDALKQKNCKYIGNDLNYSLEGGYNYILNNEMYNESKERVSINICDSTILNKKLNNSIDFIFTSPPFYNEEIYQSETIVFKTTEIWKNELVIPTFKNCFSYLKSNKKMIIDMKEKYCDDIIKSAEVCGFKFIDSEPYKITKTHYMNKEKSKNQFLLTFLKP